MTDRTSRLIDILLEQEFSPKPAWSPDADILKKIRTRRITKIGIRLALTTAAAACLMLYALYHNVIPLRDVKEPKELLPGAEITAIEKTEHIRVGEHVSVSISAGANIWIPEDIPNAVFVEKGTLQCSVEPGGGGFKVLSDAGEAEVTGTLFSVTVSNEPEPDAETTLVTMNVSVDKGTVIVRQDRKEQRVRAGEQTQIRARIRKRSRQQKRLRGKDRSENTPETQPGKISGQKAEAEPQQEPKTEDPDDKDRIDGTRNRSRNTRNNTRNQRNNSRRNRGSKK